MGDESVDEDLHQGMGRLVQALLSFAKLRGRMWRTMIVDRYQSWLSSPIIKCAMPSVLRSSPRFLHLSLFRFLGPGALSFCLRC